MGVKLEFAALKRGRFKEREKIEERNINRSRQQKEEKKKRKKV